MPPIDPKNSRIIQDQFSAISERNLKTGEIKHSFPTKPNSKMGDIERTFPKPGRKSKVKHIARRMDRGVLQSPEEYKKNLQLRQAAIYESKASSLSTFSQIKEEEKGLVSQYIDILNSYLNKPTDPFNNPTSKKLDAVVQRLKKIDESLALLNTQYRVLHSQLEGLKEKRNEALGEDLSEALKTLEDEENYIQRKHYEADGNFTTIVPFEEAYGTEPISVEVYTQQKVEREKEFYQRLKECKPEVFENIFRHQMRIDQLKPGHLKMQEDQLAALSMAIKNSITKLEKIQQNTNAGMKDSEPVMLDLQEELQQKLVESKELYRDLQNSYERGTQKTSTVVKEKVEEKKGKVELDDDWDDSSEKDTESLLSSQEQEVQPKPNVARKLEREAAISSWYHDIQEEDNLLRDMDHFIEKMKEEKAHAVLFSGSSSDAEQISTLLSYIEQLQHGPQERLQQLSNQCKRKIIILNDEKKQIEEKIKEASNNKDEVKDLVEKYHKVYQALDKEILSLDILQSTLDRKCQRLHLCQELKNELEKNRQLTGSYDYFDLDKLQSHIRSERSERYCEKTKTILEDVLQEKRESLKNTEEYQEGLDKIKRFENQHEKYKTRLLKQEKKLSQMKLSSKKYEGQNTIVSDLREKLELVYNQLQRLHSSQQRLLEEDPDVLQYKARLKEIDGLLTTKNYAEIMDEELQDILIDSHGFTIDTAYEGKSFQQVTDKKMDQAFALMEKGMLNRDALFDMVPDEYQGKEEGLLLLNLPSSKNYTEQLIRGSFDTATNPRDNVVMTPEDEARIKRSKRSQVPQRKMTKVKAFRKAIKKRIAESFIARKISKGLATARRAVTSIRYRRASLHVTTNDGFLQSEQDLFSRSLSLVFTLKNQAVLDQLSASAKDYMGENLMLTLVKNVTVKHPKYKDGIKVRTELAQELHPDADSRKKLLPSRKEKDERIEGERIEDERIEECILKSDFQSWIQENQVHLSLIKGFFTNQFRLLGLLSSIRARKDYKEIADRLKVMQSLYNDIVKLKNFSQYETLPIHTMTTLFDNLARNFSQLEEMWATFFKHNDEVPIISVSKEEERDAIGNQLVLFLDEKTEELYKKTCSKYIRKIEPKEFHSLYEAVHRRISEEVRFTEQEKQQQYDIALTNLILADAGFIDLKNDTSKEKNQSLLHTAHENHLKKKLRKVNEGSFEKLLLSLDKLRDEAREQSQEIFVPHHGKQLVQDILQTNVNVLPSDIKEQLCFYHDEPLFHDIKDSLPYQTYDDIYKEFQAEKTQLAEIEKIHADLIKQKKSISKNNVMDLQRRHEKVAKLELLMRNAEVIKASDATFTPGDYDLEKSAGKILEEIDNDIETFSSKYDDKSSEYEKQKQFLLMKKDLASISHEIAHNLNKDDSGSNQVILSLIHRGILIECGLLREHSENLQEETQKVQDRRKDFRYYVMNNQPVTLEQRNKAELLSKQLGELISSNRTVNSDAVYALLTKKPSISADGSTLQKTDNILKTIPSFKEALDKESLPYQTYDDIYKEFQAEKTQLAEIEKIHADLIKQKKSISKNNVMDLQRRREKVAKLELLMRNAEVIKASDVTFTPGDYDLEKSAGKILEEIDNDIETFSSKYDDKSSEYEKQKQFLLMKKDLASISHEIAHNLNKDDSGSNQVILSLIHRGILIECGLLREHSENLQEETQKVQDRRKDFRYYVMNNQPVTLEQRNKAELLSKQLGELISSNRTVNSDAVYALLTKKPSISADGSTLQKTDNILKTIPSFKEALDRVCA